MISHAVRRRVCQVRFNSTETIRPAPRLSSSWGDIVIPSRQDIIAEKKNSRSMASTLLEIRKKAFQEPVSVSESTTVVPVALAVPTNPLYINPRGMPLPKHDMQLGETSLVQPSTSTPQRSQTDRRGPRQPLDSQVQRRTPPRQSLDSDAQRRGPRQRLDSQTMKRGPRQQPDPEPTVDPAENRASAREDSRPRYQLLPQSYERKTRFTGRKEEDDDDDDELDEELQKFAAQYPQDEADEAARLHHKEDFEGHGMSFEKPQALSPDIQISFDLHGDSPPRSEQLGKIVASTQLSTRWASAHFGGDYTRFSSRDSELKPFRSISPVQHALLTMSQRSDLGVNARREASKKIGSSTTKV